MKKNILTLFIVCLSLTAFTQFSATNFTAIDCGGTNHTLFNELDSGKVIVLVWVMPCGGCINAAVSADSIVQNYTVSNPGRVFLYLCDDDGGASCPALQSWAVTNGISHGACLFSDSTIKMSDYGSTGMPKIVVLGGYSHSVFHNENGNLTLPDFESAIDDALLATGAQEQNSIDLSLTLYPNPGTSESFMIAYDLQKDSPVTAEIYSMAGEKLSTVFSEFQTIGRKKKKIDLNLYTNGMYLLKLNVGGWSETRKFSVIR